MKPTADEIVEDFQATYLKNAKQKDKNIDQTRLLKLFWQYVKDNGYLSVEMY